MAKTLGELPVGTLVKDIASTYYGQQIVWKIADQNHEGYPSNSTTLITDKIIKFAGFDGKEANNSNADRQKYGNNRYRTSNIRQWLNSEDAAGSWWTAQLLYDGKSGTNCYDTPPTTANMGGYNGYDTVAGFMTNLSAGFKAALLTTTLIVAKNTVTDGGSSETVQDKIFLASTTEVGLHNENNIAEGAKLAILGSYDYASLITYSTVEACSNSNHYNTSSSEKAYYWWLRTPSTAHTDYVRIIQSNGVPHVTVPNDGGAGVRPLCNLASNILVSNSPDSDGV